MCVVCTTSQLNTFIYILNLLTGFLHSYNTTDLKRLKESLINSLLRSDRKEQEIVLQTEEYNKNKCPKGYHVCRVFGDEHTLFNHI